MATRYFPSGLCLGMEISNTPVPSGEDKTSRPYLPTVSILASRPTEPPNPSRTARKHQRLEASADVIQDPDGQGHADHRGDVRDGEDNGFLACGQGIRSEVSIGFWRESRTDRKSRASNGFFRDGKSERCTGKYLGEETSPNLPASELRILQPYRRDNRGLPGTKEGGLPAAERTLMFLLTVSSESQYQHRIGGTHDADSQERHTG
jgi:hypothetical protein